MLTRTASIVAATLFLLGASSYGQHTTQPQGQRPASPLPATSDTGNNLPLQPLGPSDLVRLSVYDSPELSRSFRVDQKGELELPMLKQPVNVKGLMPEDAAKLIADDLRNQHMLVNPIVDISVVEYRSRAITVSGAVKSPSTIQELKETHLLDAINEAGGLSNDAGVEVVVEKPGQEPRHILLRDLLDGSHPDLNVMVNGGDRISVPEMQKIFVVGQVKAPGAFPFADAQDTTVLKAIAMSGGLESFNKSTIYIFREKPGSSTKEQIPVPLRAIMDRKAPDVALSANDILYVPTNRGLKNTASVLSHISGMGNTAVSAAIWSAH
jgi:polysaccharide export outer membrane protein